MRVGLLLMKNVFIPLGVLIPLGLTTPASTTDEAIQKKIYGSSMTGMIISNEQMKDITEIF